MWQEKGPRRTPTIRRPLGLPKVGPVAQPSFAELARDLFTDLPTQITNFAGAGPRAASQELKRQVPTNLFTLYNVGRMSSACVALSPGTHGPCGTRSLEKESQDCSNYGQLPGFS